MKEYKYNEGTHSVNELPEMKEPDRKKYFGGVTGNLPTGYTVDLKRYNEHIASLKTYNVPSEFWDYWKHGEDLEEIKNFKVREKPVGCKANLCSCGYLTDEALFCGNLLTEDFAVPMEESQMNLWEEIRAEFIMNNNALRHLEEHFIIKRKIIL